jgi:membrane-associated phospholipid phosphatase
VNSLSTTVARRAIITALTGSALLVGAYLLAVWTSSGQRFEDAVLGAAERATGGEQEVRATRTLEMITVSSVAVAVSVVIAIGLLRRRPSLALLATGVIAASLVITEIVERSAPRPLLLEAGVRREDQSFPSGHAAIAMSVMCALAMVVPYRFRGWVLLPASFAATAIGLATITAHWHRPSDVVASDLIAVLCTGAAVATLARWGSVRPATLRTAPGRVARALLVGAYGVVALVAVVGSLSESPLTAGRAIVVAGAAAVTLTLLALLHRVDLTAAPAALAEDREMGC